MRLPTQPEATSCFRFDGSSSYVSRNADIGNDPGQSYSISFWFKPSRMSAAYARYFSKSNSAGGTTALLSLSTDSPGTRARINVFLRDSAGTTKIADVRSTINYNPTIWNHVVFTDNNGTCALYINGVLDTSNFNYTVGAGGYVFDRTSIGALVTNTVASYLPGLMYDARVYNRILSATEAQDLADGKEISSTSLALRWIGNQNGGATVLDASGNGNTGTFTTPFYLRDSPFYPVRSRVGGNLLYNGDFEIYPTSDNVATTTTSRWIDGTNGTSTVERHATGWGINASGSFSAICDTTTKFSGSASLKLSTTGTGSFIESHQYRGAGALSLYRQFLIPCRPSTSYTLTYQMKTNLVSGDSASGAKISVQDRNSAGTSLTSYGGTVIKTTTDWTLYTVTFTTAATAAFLDINPNIYGHTGTGTLIMDAWFDDIVLTETTPVTRNTATGRLAVQDFGTSLRFPGSGNNRVTVTNPTVLDFTNNFTVNCWSKTATAGSTGASELYMLAKALPAGGTFKYAMFVGNNNRTGFGIYNGTTNPRVDDTTPVVIDRWTMWTGTYDGANLRLYRDGVLVATSATTMVLPTGTSDFEIGRRAGASDRNFKGNIDDVRAWNRALTATEITSLYQNGYTGSLSSGLVAAYLLNEGSGTTAINSVGGNNGTITGATYSTDVPCVNRSSV